MAPTDVLHAALRLARQAGEAHRAHAVPPQCQLVEPILAGTYVLISEWQGAGHWLPVGWLAYALLDAEAEWRHVSCPSQTPLPSDWDRGDRLWLMHWIAAPGHSLRLRPVVRHLFHNMTARSLDPRTQRVITWRGEGCTAREALAFWQQRPVHAQRRTADHATDPVLSSSLAAGLR